MGLSPRSANACILIYPLAVLKSINIQCASVMAAPHKAEVHNTAPVTCSIHDYVTDFKWLALRIGPYGAVRQTVFPGWLGKTEQKRNAEIQNNCLWSWLSEEHSVSVSPAFPCCRFLLCPALFPTPITLQVPACSPAPATLLIYLYIYIYMCSYFPNSLFP